MNTCETCLFWGKLGDFPKNDTWQFCSLTETVDGSLTIGNKDSLAKAWDNEQWHACLETHKNFGCNQYKPK